ncbi:hypothetical protein FQN54_008053 [Arachnomyces sp. PD_36]|nr:hypothetical protein FQN54_008053 [Arachnomyces sp. PD_36]
MEHLPLVTGAIRPELPIPFVVKSASNFPYVRGEDDFIHFPQRHLRELRFIYLDLSPKEALLSLMQAWLYFGVLTEFYQLPVGSDILTQQGPAGESLVSTAALRGLESRWKASLPARTPIATSLRRRAARRRGVLLARATWALEQFQNIVPQDMRHRSVIYSIKVLLCSLCHTARVVLLPTPTLDAVLNRLFFHPAATNDGTGTDFLLWDYMVQNGWCPFQINHLTALHSATSMTYLASMPRSKRSIGHESCLQAGCCKASQIDWAAFRSLHVAPGCLCDHVAVDERKIMAKLEDGQIPLLSCTRSTSGQFSIEIIQADTSTIFGSPTFYYAISHVWADGLGNPTGNSLPNCQFEKLYNKLKLLSKEVATTRPSFSPIALSGRDRPIVFWMDVFCIPVEKPGIDRNSELKREAIALMDLTYSCAHQVLVLDSEMEFVTAPQESGCDPLDQLKASTETLSRFTTCSWMGRSWTLQEGALASELWAHYSGNATKHRSFYTFDVPPYLKDDAPPEILAVVEDLEKCIILPSVGRGTQDMTDEAAYCISARDVQFLQVWNSLVGRSTTKPEDFHCIVANLLDFSVKELARLKDPDKSDEENRALRMSSIIMAQERLPMQLFCLPTSHACDEKEMAWLPEKPIGPRLSVDAFAHSVKVVPGKGFVMDSACLSSCFFAWPLRSTTLDFCLNLPSKTGVHPHVTLNLPTGTDIGNSYLLIYLNVSMKAHTLLTDCRKNGAAFAVIDRQNDSVKVKYRCSVNFHNCWEDHGSVDTVNHIPASAVSKKMTVCISGPNTPTALKFRRPLRVGSNLIATLPMRAMFIIVVLQLTAAILLVTIMTYPGSRQFFFNRPLIVGSTAVFYACMVALFIYYMAGLVFIFARYLSTPWVRRSYLTDKLPWYVRVLYWEKFPSTADYFMLGRRFQVFPESLFLRKPIPYGLQPDGPRKSKQPITLAGIFGSLANIFMRKNDRRVNIVPQEHELYTYDYGDDDVPLLSSNEPGFSYRDVPVPPSVSREADAETDTFSWLGEEYANTLRTINRALIETRADEVGDTFWDILVDDLFAKLWFARYGKRRKVRDFLFDIGLTNGGRK